MHIHILGICGTFMGSLAILAREKGFRVTGCDQGVYPPMSTQLETQGIELHTGFDKAQLSLGADLYVIGNAISRGNPLLEEILDLGLPYISGPQMLADHVLPGRWVLAAAGTHGKTTTSTMLAWILEYAGMKPGFLIGGVPGNFDCSARLGDSDFFVIEADEYDSAFFDKRSKFIHYRPRTFIFNNLEFDHADIFANLEAIQNQFHHVIRTIPSNGQVIYPLGVDAIDAVMERGCWAGTQVFMSEEGGMAGSQNWVQETGQAARYRKTAADGSRFVIELGSQHTNVSWDLTGDHNISNGVAALLAARHVGVELGIGAQALAGFKGVKRRMEVIGQLNGVTVYDDFAHHPTAIAMTLAGLRAKVGDERIIALIEPRSNTMRMGVHEATLLASAEAADTVVWADLSGMNWLEKQVENSTKKHLYGASVERLLSLVLQQLGESTPVHIVIMSNGGFAGIHATLLQAIEKMQEGRV